MSNKTVPKTILFISPSFGRTGSEILLLNLLKGLDKTKVKPVLFSLQNGDLLGDLPPSIPFFLPYNIKRNKREKYLKSFLKKLRINPLTYQIKKIQKRINADIWYLNTIVIDPIFLELGKKLGVKIITHFHELPNAYRFISKNHLRLIIESSDICIGCSQVVCEKIEELGHKAVRLLHSFIDTELIDQRLNKTKNSIFKQELGIAEDEFIWIVSGTIGYEKGLDYIPKILQLFSTEKFRIIWLGKIPDDGFSYYFKTIIEKNWPKKVLFPGALDREYYDYFGIGNGLLMPSREDSFSLVMLEANYLRLPIVSFDSGGVRELINDDSDGIVVPSWNAEDLVQAMRIIMSRKTNQVKQNKQFIYSIDHQNRVFHHIILALLNE